jgi:hypothetical protein
MNKSVLPIKTSSNSGGLSFRNFMVGDHGIKKLPNMDKKELSPGILSFQEITDELSPILTKLSLDNPGMKLSLDQGIDQGERSEEAQQPFISLLENEIKSSLSKVESIEDLIDKIQSLPTAVAVLTLVKVIEDIPAGNGNDIDDKTFLSKLNSVLDQENPSYSNAEPIQYSSMLKAIEQMKPNDRAKLEGQITFKKWTSSNYINRLSIVETLLSINNKLSEAITFQRQELQVKNEMLGVLEAVIDNKQIENSFSALFEKADLLTLQDLFNKTVEKLFRKDFSTNTINHYDAEDQFMTVEQINIFDQDPSLFSNKESVKNLIQLNLNFKGRFLETNPELYEKISDNWIKQDGKTMNTMSGILLEDIDTYPVKTNDSIGSHNTNGHTGFSSGQQMLELAFSKMNLHRIDKQIEVKEETFTIQLDKFISKQTGNPLDNQKPDSTTRQEFTNQLVNAFKTSKFAQLSNGTNRLVIKLNPEHLGSLTVRLVQKNGEMAARIITSTESAKELLDHSIHQLKQALPSIQVEIERFEVNTEQLIKTLKDHSDQKEKNENEYEESKSEEEQENEQSFFESLKEALNTTV